MSKVPLVTDVLEFYTKTPEGLPVWKTKGVQLTSENLLENVFVLSIDIARYFGIRHDNLLRNIRNLQKEKQLPKRLLTVEQPYESGNLAPMACIVYGLARHQTYHLIMDLTGSKARAKKHEIVNRLKSIETDLLKGAYSEAKQKASTWDGTQLLQEFGFLCSLPNRIATKKDIIKFLKIPESTLNYFLRKHSDDIKPIQLDFSTIKSIGGKSRHMNGYPMDEVVKVVCGMDTEIGIEFKKRMFGQIGAFANPYTKAEIEWRPFFSKVFDGFDLHFTYPIENYFVDYFVGKMLLVLECNGYDCHRSYDPKEEEEREKVITQKYGMVRFHHRVSMEALFNGILQVKPGVIVKLYDMEHLAK